MSRVPPFLRSPLGAASLVCATILVASGLRWSSGERPRFPLEHSNVAYSLASGLGYANPFGVLSGPTAWVPPGLPLAYAGALKAARALHVDERAPIVALNALAALAAVLLTLRFSVAAWRPLPRIAFCAGFAGYGLLDPDFLVSTGPLTAAETALLLAGLCEARRSPGSGRAWGLVFAANALLCATHPGLALAGAVASAWVGVDGLRTEAGRSAGLLRSAAVAALAGILASAGPWTARNRAVFHQWIPAKSNGYFEAALSQRETDDGVLSEAALVAGHPSTNPRLLADYARLGEAAFLEPYRGEARDLVRAQPGRYALYSLNRLFNAICLSKPPGDIELLSVRLPPAEAARMVGRRLILPCVGAPNFFWALSDATADQESAALAAARIENPRAVLADWSRAQRAIRARAGGLGSLAVRFLWSGFASVCCLLAVGARRGPPDRLVLAAAAVYLMALAPNVLITHDLRHQASFTLLFALFLGGAVDALLSRSPEGADWAA